MNHKDTLEAISRIENLHPDRQANEYLRLIVLLLVDRDLNR